jgi:hypothetical protein
MFGKVYRPSRLSVPYKSHMRRCSSTSSYPFIAHTTPHTCHDTAARQGTSGTGDTSTTSRARTQTGSSDPARAPIRATRERPTEDRRPTAATCRSEHVANGTARHTGHDGKHTSTASRFLTSAGRTAPDTDGHTDTHAHTKGRGCLEHPLLLELKLKLARRVCGVAIPGPRAPWGHTRTLSVAPITPGACE